MYSWTDDTSGWLGKKSYRYDQKHAKRRSAEAARASAAGPRSYEQRREPNPKLIDPKKRVSSNSKNPLIVAVDVTGSMASWPFEIFDRLPLLFTTLAQYREDLEICFAAIGDAGVDRWPLQVTQFAKGYDLEQQLKSLYGEGGGGDAPESYGLFAYWVRNHVSTPNASWPFLIMFGDATMHPTIPARQVREVLGDGAQGDLDAQREWNQVANSWNAYFLRRPGGGRGDTVDKQWRRALGKQRVIQIQDEARAVDYAMGIVAKSWGHFTDFKNNMAARQDETKIHSLEVDLDEAKVRVLVCPECAAPIPPEAFGRFVCEFCEATLSL